MPTSQESPNRSSMPIETKRFVSNRIGSYRISQQKVRRSCACEQHLVVRINKSEPSAWRIPGSSPRWWLRNENDRPNFVACCEREIWINPNNETDKCRWCKIRAPQLTSKCLLYLCAIRSYEVRGWPLCVKGTKFVRFMSTPHDEHEKLIVSPCRRLATCHHANVRMVMWYRFNFDGLYGKKIRRFAFAIGKTEQQKCCAKKRLARLPHYMYRISDCLLMVDLPFVVQSVSLLS